MSLKTRQISHYTLVYDDDESEFVNRTRSGWECVPEGVIAWLYDDDHHGAEMGHFNALMEYSEIHSTDGDIVKQATAHLASLRDGTLAILTAKCAQTGRDPIRFEDNELGA